MNKDIRESTAIEDS